MDDLDRTAPSALHLHLDLDYIVRLVESGSVRGIEFWVAPATLIFDNVWDIVGSLRSVCMPLELRSLRREPNWRVEENCWHLEGRDMDLRFQASRYTLYVRKTPALRPPGAPDGRTGRHQLRPAPVCLTAVTPAGDGGIP
ncbi:hypothetical protein ACH4OY_08540 [Micromonospora rubida]|uniref:Uncharacterized protein n=1 Tax=Micromonospora rubida TaxID=2697657 RepID=A0ABW7SGC8_9ACTN